MKLALSCKQLWTLFANYITGRSRASLLCWGSPQKKNINFLAIAMLNCILQLVICKNFSQKLWNSFLACKVWVAPVYFTFLWLLLVLCHSKCPLGWIINTIWENSSLFLSLLSGLKVINYCSSGGLVHLLDFTRLIPFTIFGWIFLLGFCNQPDKFLGTACRTNLSFCSNHARNLQLCSSRQITTIRAGYRYCHYIDALACSDSLVFHLFME